MTTLPTDPNYWQTAETTEEWGYRDGDGTVLRASTEERARYIGARTGLPAVRRTVATGPWEVQP